MQHIKMYLKLVLNAGLWCLSPESEPSKLWVIGTGFRAGTKIYRCWGSWSQKISNAWSRSLKFGIWRNALLTTIIQSLVYV